MENKYKYSKALTIILIVVIVGIIGVLAYIGYTVFKEKKTKETYTEAANNFEIAGRSSTGNGTSGTLNTINMVESSSADTLEGFEIIGTIEIPKTDLHCPILAEVTKRPLEIAVAQMYTTSALNKPGNTVIYGHNYRNSLFFSRNDELQKGDTLYITDKEKNKLKYEIYDSFITTSTDTTFYARTSKQTGGKAEVTLSTCTDDASTTDRRLIILARETE